jgi:hypothetical protein
MAPKALFVECGAGHSELNIGAPLKAKLKVSSSCARAAATLLSQGCNGGLDDGNYFASGFRSNRSCRLAGAFAISWIYGSRGDKWKSGAELFFVCAPRSSFDGFGPG